MVYNSQISFITESGGGQDANFNPVSVTRTNSTYVGANFKVLKREYKKLINGEYRDAKYSVMVDMNDYTPLNVSTFKEVSLIDSFGASLGNFQIHDVQILKLTNKLLIIV